MTIQLHHQNQPYKSGFDTSSSVAKGEEAEAIELREYVADHHAIAQESSSASLGLSASMDPSLGNTWFASSTAEKELPPTDRGPQAWMFLLSATVIEILVWGMPFSVGVLHSYWTTALFPAGTPGISLLSLAATLQTGLMYCTAVFFGPLLARYPHERVYIQASALTLSSCGILASAFVTKPWHLVVTLGILYPASGAFYLPAATLLFEWFHARRGLASGIMYAGTGLGGTIFPFVIQGLLSRFGYRATMVSLAVGFATIGGVALLNIHPRTPLSPRGSAAARMARRIDPSFLKRTPVWAFTGAILLTSLGNFIPSVWIPSFALDLNLSKSDGTLLVAVMNAASVPGLLLLGYLSDHMSLRIVISISCFGSALSCLLLWGFAKSLPVLVVFCIFFGALGLSFSALWTKLIGVIAQDDPFLPSLIFSIFAFGRGIGNISSGPVANALLKTKGLSGAAGGYGVKNYGALLLYSGLTMVLGSAVGIMYRLEPKRKN